MKGKNKYFIKRRFFCIVILILNLFNSVAYAKDEVLDQAKEILRAYYVNELPSEIWKAKSINELLEQLGDPYTQHFQGEGVDGFLNVFNMRYLGIGVVIEMLSGGGQVKSLELNSPAYEAGLKEGDIIISVDDKILQGMVKEEATELINGEEGKTLSFNIIRRGEPMSFKLAPRMIPYPTVIGEVLYGHIGYIRIKSFGTHTHNEFEYILGKLITAGVNSYVIDLRYNQGGYLKSVVDIAGYFIGDKVLMKIEDKLEGRGIVKATPAKELIKEPVVVLINEGSASSAEILAAALKSYNIGILVGSPTYGKGMAQSVFKLKDGSLFKASTLQFYSPEGEAIEGTGVKPHIITRNMDSKFVGLMLLKDTNTYLSEGRYVSHQIGDFELQIDLKSLNKAEDWETYRQIVYSSGEIATSLNLEAEINSNYGVVPRLQYTEVPKTIYKVGERASFKLRANGYGDRVQYRCVLFDEETKQYHDLWDTKDNYYDKWIPRGEETFIIGFPINKPGKYRIMFYVKRAGMLNKKTLFTDRGCDSYVEELPILVVE